MPEIIYYVASSIDGFLAPVDGSLDWLAPFEGTGEDHGYAEFYGSIDAVLLGSHTYEQVLGFGEWPYPGKPTWVFTTRALPAAGPELHFTSATPEALAADLDAQGIRRAWLVGGGTLAGNFQRAGLISEYMLAIVPVVLGSGIGVLGGAGSVQSLALVDAIPYVDGIIMCRYVPR